LLLAPPWTDRTGRFVLLKFITFGVVLAPAVWLLVEAMTDRLGSRPFTEAIHQSGLWSIRFLAVTLAITPFRRTTRWSRLILIRRMLGLAALGYAVLHLGLYIVDQHFDLLHVAKEILLRIYLLIGFVAFVGLCLLGVTSNEAMIKRIGSERWNALHQIVYGIAALGTVHFFMQSKADVSEPITMGGIIGLLLALRLVVRYVGDPRFGGLIGLAVGSAMTTACLEALWYWLKVGADPSMVLLANFDFSFTVRPAWYVLATGALLVVSRLLRRASAARPPRPVSGSEAIAS
jgi:sulfoxide reductase heme-binding subunit YedZ